MNERNTKIFELAKKLYGLHKADSSLSYNIEIRKILEHKMKKYAREIEDLGAKIEVNPLNIGNQPFVKDLNNKGLSYDIGRMEQHKIEDLIRENLNYFIKNY